MKTIRIALYKGEGGLFNSAIRGMQSLRTPEFAHYSHVELVVNGNWYTSSHMDGGVRVRQISGKSGNWDFIDLSVTEEQERALETFFAYEAGKGYDYLGIAMSQVLPLEIEDPNRWSCSEIVARALKQCGVVPLKRHSQWYSPARIANELIRKGWAWTKN